MTASRGTSRETLTDDRRLVLHNKGMHQFGYRLHRIEPQAWGLPTPCEDWTVRDLVAHVVAEQRWIPLLLSGMDVKEAGRQLAGDGDSLSGGEVLSPDARTAWDLAAAPAILSFAALEDLSMPISLSRGMTPAREYLGELTFDLAVHAWDLGQAIGLTDDLPADLAELSLQQLQSFGDLSGSDYFHPAVPVPDDAPLTDRLVAAAGRAPR